MDALIQILSVAIQALGAVAPSVAAAFTGGQSPAEASAAAQKAASELPKRTGPGGAWDSETERIAQGGEPTT